jgi:hypothetical protein
MFGAEPQERWSLEEKEEFEQHATARLRRCLRDALYAGLALAANTLCIIPFLAGHRLHSHWESGKYLLFTAMALLLWFLRKVGSVWASWQSARETRREFEDADQPTD